MLNQTGKIVYCQRINNNFELYSKGFNVFFKDKVIARHLIVLYIPQ